MKLTDVIRRPLVTEKTTILREDGRTVVFTRMGLSMTNDNVKAYRGGAHAQHPRAPRGRASLN